jgi:hypothetical protein
MALMTVDRTNKGAKAAPFILVVDLSMIHVFFFKTTSFF